MVDMDTRLLIEPVWNRNQTTVDISGALAALAFNRTSMESKLDLCFHDGSEVGFAFNRTSMESKPCSRRCSSSSFSLLIEPVWNRNVLSVITVLSLSLFF